MSPPEFGYVPEQMKHKLIGAIFIGLAAAICVASAARAAEPTTIRIAHNGFSSEMPFYVGKDAGIFAKHGFNVEPIFIVGGSTTIQALIGKSLDLLMGGAAPMLAAVMNGAQLKSIGGISNRIPFTLQAPPEIAQAVLARELGYKVLLNFVEKEIDYTQIGIIAREDMIKTQPEMLRRFMRAYVESIRYFKTHKEEALKKSQQLQKLADREALEAGYVSNGRALPDDGRPTIKGTQLVIDAAMLEDPRAKNYTPRQLMDLSFLP